MEDRLITHFLLDGVVCAETVVVVGAEAVGVVVVVISPVVLSSVLPDLALLFGCLPKTLYPLKNLCLTKVLKLWLHKYPFMQWTSFKAVLKKSYHTCGGTI